MNLETEIYTLSDIITDIKGMFRSIVIVTSKPNHAESFYGYGNLFFAKKYAIKRFKRWFKNTNRAKDVFEKHHGVFPLSKYQLIVLNRSEMKLLKKKHIVEGSANYKKVYKREKYWSTEELKAKA